jgi:signal transduction histidine kinase
VTAPGDAPFLRTPPPAAGGGVREPWPRRVARFAAVGAVVAAAVALLVHEKRRAPTTPVLSFGRAAFVAAPGAVPPPDDAAEWRPARLTDDWWRGRPGVAEGWYRVDLDLRVPPDRLWAIYLPSVSMNAAVLLNGELLGSGGRFTPTVARNWNRPLYFRVPNNLLRSGRNTVHVRLKAAPPGTGLLGRFYAGPEAMLRPSFRRRELFRVTIPLVIAVAGAVMGAAMLLVWVLRRERVYGWFGLGNLVWAARDLNLLVVHTGVPAPFWDWLWIMGIGWVILLVVPYVHALLGLRRPGVDRAVIAYGLAHSVVLTGIAVVDPSGLDRYWRHVWDPLLLPIGLYPTWLMLRSTARSRDLTASCVLASGLVVFALAIHDLLVLLGVVAREHGFLFHYGAAPVIAVFGSILLLRFVDGMREVERLNRGLEARVREKTAELEAGYRRLADVEASRARSEERARILREVHDGVGGQLVAALALLEAGRVDAGAVERTVRDALDEMRLTVDTFGAGTSRDAVTALAMLRQRVQPRLEAVGLRVVWRVADGVPLPALGSELTLDLLRIVQEALTNVLQHAGARTVEVSIGAAGDGTGLTVAVRDDGGGIPSGRTVGHGLANMRRRARRLGATLDVASSPAGTTVTVVLPAPGR